jgi:hypothetical protein
MAEAAGARSLSGMARVKLVSFLPVLSDFRLEYSSFLESQIKHCCTKNKNNELYSTQMSSFSKRNIFVSSYQALLDFWYFFKNLSSVCLLKTFAIEIVSIFFAIFHNIFRFFHDFFYITPAAFRSDTVQSPTI